MTNIAKDTSGPAFPCEYPEGNFFTGMSLRDWFAGQALCGELASQDGEREWTAPYFPDLAKTVYAMADAMLKRRQQR